MKLLHQFSELNLDQYSVWRPLADIYRIGQSWVVKLELAGVRIEDIELNATGRCLMIQGIRRDLLIGEERHAYSMEIAYNRFGRAIELPCEVEQAHIVTEYRDGMLLIRLQMEAEQG